MRIALTVGLASALAITAVVPASAQYSPAPQYQRDMQNYQEDRADYAEKRSDYQEARDRFDAGSSIVQAIVGDDQIRLA